jgi:hypothetical protein
MTRVGLVRLLAYRLVVVLSSRCLHMCSALPSQETLHQTVVQLHAVHACGLRCFRELFLDLASGWVCC